MRYVMDDVTFDHLNAWIEREIWEKDQARTREVMIAFLEGDDVENAEYSLSHGWSHVCNLANDAATVEGN